MVRAFLSQSFPRSLNTNTNFSPQAEKAALFPIDGGWIDDLGNQFIDDSGNPIMFEVP